jgi:hypothetical protein
MSRGFDTKRAKFPDHVGLVGVAMIGGESGPGFRRAHGGHLPQTGEAENADELLGRNTDGGKKATLNLARRKAEVAGDLRDWRYVLGAGQAIDDGNDRGVYGSGQSQLLEEQLVERGAVGFCLGVPLRSEQDRESAVERGGDLRERKKLVRKGGSWLPEKRSAAGRVESDTKGIDGAAIFYLHGERQRADHDARGLVAGKCRAREADGRAKIENQFDVAVGQDCSGGDFRGVADNLPVGGDDILKGSGSRKPFFIAKVHANPRCLSPCRSAWDGESIALVGLFLLDERGPSRRFADGQGAEKRRTEREMGRPTQKMWMTTPMIIIWKEKGYFVAAESGMTMRFMKK